MQAVFTTILRKGSAKEAQLFLEYINNFNRRDIQPEGAPAEQEFDPVKLAEMTTALERAGLSGVTADHERLAKTFNDLALSEDDENDDE